MKDNVTFKVPNPFKLNDCRMDTFLKIIISIQLAVLILILLDTLGINVSLIREIVSIFYLLFVPGILMLRILRLHELSSIETIFYTIGLSIFSIMFLGAIIDLSLPAMGITKPLSLFYILITMTSFLVILTILSYFRDKDYQGKNIIEIKELPSTIILFLCLIPFLAVIGTYLVNYYQNNILLMIMIAVIAIMPILVGFNKIPRLIYPFLTFIISLSLLFHTSLISNYIWGWDMQFEYYLANNVINNSFWDPNFFSSINSMLSITIFAPIISIISGMNLKWVFKIIYPLIFSLVPLGLYFIFKKQTSDKIAFLSVFFFMSIFTFYTELNQLGRQEIAEFFFIPFLILLLDESMRPIKRSLLLVIFALSIVVSHYGFAYVFALTLVLVYIILFLTDKKRVSTLVKNVRNLNFEDVNPVKTKDRRIKISFVALFLISVLTWYIYTSSSYDFISIILIGNHISGSITDLFNPQTAQGLSALTVTITSPLHNVAKYLNLLFQLFIGVGVLLFTYKLIFKQENIKFKREFMIFALVSLFVLFISIALPFFGSALDETRLYHMTLFFLAPFSILGGIEVFKIFNIISKKPWKKKQTENALKIMSILIMISFLFYTGFIYQFTGDNPTSFSLSNVDYTVYDHEEVSGVYWIYLNKNNNNIYADGYRAPLFASIMAVHIKSYQNWVYPGSYLYLGSYNIKSGKILLNTTSMRYEEYSNIIGQSSEIYDNGGSVIYLS
jgi:uncharacterized membrane protein